MVRRRARLSDVAAAAGVSPTTASFVLNAREAAIPATTRRRVMEAAQRLGYHPHASAQALATGKTHRLGIVVNAPESFASRDTYFSEVMGGIVAGAVGHDQNLLLHSARYHDWHRLCSEILGGLCDGVLLVARFANDELTTALLEAEFPTVCVSYRVEHPRCVWVDSDNEQGAYLAVRHLLELGHRRIALFYPGQGVSWGAERYEGAVRALVEAGLGQEALCPYTWTETSLPSAIWVSEAVEYLLRQPVRPTAVVCCEEARSAMLLEALPAAGLRVPAECALVSFNSTELSGRSRPPMTSVWQPLRQIGETAVDMLIERVEERPMETTGRRFAMQLDVRQSCGAVTRIVARPGRQAAVLPAARGLDGSVLSAARHGDH